MSKRNGYRQKEREAMRRSVDRVIAEREFRSNAKRNTGVFEPPTDSELDELLTQRATEAREDYAD